MARAGAVVVLGLGARLRTEKEDPMLNRKKLRVVALVVGAFGGISLGGSFAFASVVITKYNTSGQEVPWTVTDTQHRWLVDEINCMTYLTLPGCFNVVSDCVCKDQLTSVPPWWPSDAVSAYDL
jgi:hypothetical protein